MLRSTRSDLESNSNTSIAIQYSVKIHIPNEEFQPREQEIKQTFVNRRSRQDKPLMFTTDLYQIIHPGNDLNLAAVSGSNETIPTTLTLQSLQEYSSMTVTIDAKWFHASEKPAKTGADANVFGGTGILQLADAIDTLYIPTHSASEVSSEFLASFSAMLVPANQKISGFNTSPYDLYFVTYHFDEDYIEDYVLKPDGGGGIFVEEHDFPHVFMPMHPDCKGGLILGRNEGKDRYSFAAFEIPFGYALHIKANAIHGDSFFTGPYTISLTEGGKASTVLFRTNKEEIQRIRQVSAKTFYNNQQLLFASKPSNTNSGNRQDAVSDLKSPQKIFYG
jgi:hypothetical protein